MRVAWGWNGKILVYVMIVAVVADVLTAIACWILVFT
jgi:Tfp pilus assembly major pilin PilA